MRLWQVLGLMFMLLQSWQLSAWQIELRSVEKEQQLWFSHAGKLNNVDVYLVWLNLSSPENGLASWTVQDGWVKGEVKPVTNHSLHIENIAQLQLTTLPYSCDSKHSCILALVALEHQQDWNDTALWQQVHVLPLTDVAAKERLPGQTVFATLDNYYTDTGWERLFFAEEATMLEMAPAPAPTADAAKGESVTTEKPDIFRLVDKQILYANNQAQRFQVIDVVGQAATPQITASIALKGYPSELYVIDQYKILMQSDYQNNAFFSVFKQDENGLHLVDEYQIEGSLQASRRRNNAIYAVTHGHNGETNVLMLVLQNDGKLLEQARHNIKAYPDSLAIFTDYLVLINYGERYWSTKIQVYNLAAGFAALPSIEVPGRVPSEFHVHVKNELLHVVYENLDRNSPQRGTSVAIFDLQQSMRLLGQIDNIAPTESLFAARFAGDKVYIVTFERTDPLWVIDISDPTNLRILGELKIPGWSEKMFFHDDILFAVGIFDVPEPNETWSSVRRASVSLFDVRDPHNPSFLDRYIPFIGQSRWSHSLAIYDEQALQLDWAKQFAAFPVDSWEIQPNNYLQMLSFTGNKFVDNGLIPSPIPLKRSLQIDANTVVALGDQALLTVDLPTRSVLAELELSTQLTWLQYVDRNIWAAAIGQSGYSRFYKFSAHDAENPQQRWSLPNNYQNIVMDKQQAVFFNSNPLMFQSLDLATGILATPQVIEQREEYKWYDRPIGLVRNAQFYLAERRGQSMGLRVWDLASGREGMMLSLPGEPLGFAADNLLVTQEVNKLGLQLNLLRLESNQAVLISSKNIDNCNYISSWLWYEDELYLTCQLNRYYYYGYVEERYETPAFLLRLQPSNNLIQTGKWQIDNNSQLRAVSSGVMSKVLLQQNNYSYRGFMIMPEPDFYRSNNCKLYQLQADDKMDKLLEIEDCSQAAILLDKQVWTANGFAGIKIHE